MAKDFKIVDGGVIGIYNYKKDVVNEIAEKDLFTGKDGKLNDKFSAGFLQHCKRILDDGEYYYEIPEGYYDAEVELYRVNQFVKVPANDELIKVDDMEKASTYDVLITPTVSEEVAYYLGLGHEVRVANEESSARIEDLGDGLYVYYFVPTT